MPRSVEGVSCGNRTKVGTRILNAIGTWKDVRWVRRSIPTMSWTLVCTAWVLGLSSCTLLNRVDACGERGAVPHDVNTRTEGAQTIEQFGLAATVGGGAMLVFTSTDTATGLAEVRRTRTGPTADSRPTCEVRGEPTISPPAGEQGASFDWPVTASATVSGESGIVVWREVRDGRTRLWGAMVTNNGCINLQGITPPILIAEPDPSSAIGFAHAVALGPRVPSPSTAQRYAISWTEETQSGTNDIGTHLFGVVTPLPLNAATFQPTVNQPDGSKASLTPDGDLPANHTLVKLEDGRFGLLWYENSSLGARVRFATLDDTFRVIAGPVTLTSTPLPSGAPTSLAAAYDGAQILVAWVAPDEQSSEHAYATFLDTQARLLRSERSPGGSPFRLGSTDEATETDLGMTSLSGGGFLTAWTEHNTRESAVGTHLRGIGLSAEGRVMFSRSACDRTDFALAPELDGDQSKPQLATLDDRTLLLMYTNLGGGATDDRNGTGIRGTGLKQEDLFAQ